MFICDIFMFFIDVVFGVCKIYMYVVQNTLFDPQDDSVDLQVLHFYSNCCIVCKSEAKTILVEVKEVVEKYIFDVVRNWMQEKPKNEEKIGKRKKRKKDYGIIYKIKRPFNKVADEKQISKSLSHKYLKELIQKILNLKHE